MKLTKEQSKIVGLNRGQHLVLAPPGTGKTELLVQRLSSAVRSGVEQSKMACLTFTNRAAKNMLERVEKEIGEHEIFIGNIHSYCNVFLRDNRAIAQSTSLLDEEDVELIFKELMHDLPGRLTVSELLKLNSFIKQQKLAFPESVLQDPQIEFNSYNDEQNAVSICTQYEQIKKESNFIDFDDLLTLTYAHLSKNVKNKPIFEWLQIDEVQDLSPLQWAIVDKISHYAVSHRVFFGDYEQAIFSFMGAKLEILDSVAKESVMHHLQHNFRSPQYLLDLYNVYAKALLKPNWEHEPKSLCGLEKTEQSLAYKEIRGEESEEIDWIVKNRLLKKSCENTAVLVRTNRSADMFAQKLNENYVEYFKISGFDLFRRRIIKDLMAFLNIIVDDNDRNSWTRNLHLYGKIATLKESRVFVNNMFAIGINPLDFIEKQGLEKTFLDNFLKEFQNRRVVVFDTETTGLDTKSDDIIQIAAIEIVKGKLGEVFEVYINTKKDLTESQKVHKISKNHLDRHAINKIEALQKFVDFVGGDTLIAHNLEYDMGILRNNLHRCGVDDMLEDIELFDSIEIAKRLYPNLPSYKLEYLLNQLNIEGKNSHNALDDVKATANLILYFEELIKKDHDKRVIFLDNYRSILRNFQSRFSPLYRAVSGRFSDHLAIEEIIDMVVSYMSDHLQYEIEESIYDEIDKLTKHMGFKCKIDEVLVSINKYIPEYVKYKESDLVLGDEKIVITTVHKAKGLEFEDVIIPGCTDDNYPSYYSKQSGEKAILEDARLLYVAMTRTKRKLLFTSHTLKVIQTKRGPWELSQHTSRFLKPVLDTLNS